jgi:membrane protease YdiL (CAAX protease family)
MAVIHQEGVVGLIAVVGLAFREGGPLPALWSARGPLEWIGLGIGSGLALAAVLWSLRSLAPLARLEHWQRELIGSWSRSEAIGVAVLSGMAEEALIRALLQPLVGLWIAAAVFALLHLLPDRRLWFWPLMAFVLGLAFGVLFTHAGYPACALSHAVVNVVGFLRLKATEQQGQGSV